MWLLQVCKGGTGCAQIPGEAVEITFFSETEVGVCANYVKVRNTQLLYSIPCAGNSDTEPKSISSSPTQVVFCLFEKGD